MPVVRGFVEGDLSRFVNREHEMRLFKAACADVRTGAAAFKVLGFYGDGGIGKSTLSRRMIAFAESDANPFACGSIDFKHEGNHNADIALYRLKMSLQSAGLAFPAFSLAVLAYGRRFRSEATYFDSEHSFHAGLGPYADLAGAVWATTGLDAVRSVVEIACDLSRRMEHHQMRQAIPVLQRLDQMDCDELLAMLPQLFAIDLNAGLGARPGKVAVVAMDHYERLWRRSIRDFVSEEREGWVRTLISQSRGAVWLVSGRDFMDWDGEPEVHVLPVGGLSPEDSRQLLSEKLEVRDAGCIEAIQRSAAGVPYYLETSALLYHEMRGNGDEPTPESVGGSREKVLKRLLTYLDPSQEDTIRILSSLPFWDAVMFETAVSEFDTGYPPTSCRRFADEMWSVERYGTGLWGMHDELRHHLQMSIESTDSVLWGRLREFSDRQMVRFDDRMEPLLRDSDDRRLPGILVGLLRKELAVADEGSDVRRASVLKRRLGSALLLSALTVDESAQDETCREAAALFREAVEALLGLYGVDSAELFAAFDGLAQALQEMSEHEAAVAVMERAVGMLETVADSAYDDLAVRKLALAQEYGASGRWDSAHDVLAAIDLTRVDSEDVHRQVQDMLESVLTELGESDEAVDMLLTDVFALHPSSSNMMDAAGRAFEAERWQEAAEVGLRLHGLGEVYGSHMLLFLLRSGLVSPKSDWPVEEEILRSLDSLPEGSVSRAYSRLSRALDDHASLRTGVTWIQLVDLVSSIDNRIAPEVLAWWTCMPGPSSAEGQLLIGIAELTGRLVVQDSTTAKAKLSRARDEGWFVPNWVLFED